jgi:hypothetical protein
MAGQSCATAGIKVKCGRAVPAILQAEEFALLPHGASRNLRVFLHSQRCGEIVEAIQVICPAHRMDAKRAEWLLRHGITLRPDAYAAHRRKIKGWMQNHQVSHSSRKNLEQYKSKTVQITRRQKKKKKRESSGVPSDLDRFQCRIRTSALLSAYLRR